MESLTSVQTPVRHTAVSFPVATALANFAVSIDQTKAALILLTLLAFKDDEIMVIKHCPMLNDGFENIFGVCDESRQSLQDRMSIK